MTNRLRSTDERADKLADKLAQRLKFLQSDPDNQNLYLDTLDLAMSLADWPCVDELLGRAPAAIPAPLLANYRGTMLIASSRPEEAWQVLSPWLDKVEGAAAEVLRYNAAYALALCGKADLALQVIGRNRSAPMNDDLVSLELHLLLLQGQADDALKISLAYCEQGGQDARVLGFTALILTDVGQYTKAEQLAGRALRAADDVNAFYALGMCQFQGGRPQDALGAFKRALSLDVRHGRAWLGQGLVHLALNQLQDAQQCLLHAVEHNPQHPGSWHALGWALFAMRDLAGAERAFNQALQVDRNFAETHGALAVVALARGYREEARHLIDVALRLDPHAYAAHYARSLLLESEGQAGRANDLVAGLLQSPVLDGLTLLQAINRVRRSS